MSEDKNLREAGLKVTLPRVRILEIFDKSLERHLSADDVYKKILDSGDEVGLATVYRVLTQFESAGILEKQNFESGHSVYELASNPDFDEHHDHMVCIKTGKELNAIGKVSNNNPGPEETERIGLLKTIGKIVNPANNATEVSKIIIIGIVLEIG